MESIWRSGALRLREVFPAAPLERLYLESQLLLAHALGCRREDLWTGLHAYWSDERADDYQRLLGRRCCFEPIAYILGQQEFYGLEFKVTPEVLIPRPETEALVVGAMDWLSSQLAAGQKRPEELTVLDIGTGSGCVAIALAKLFPGVRVWATDISLGALAVAKHNAKQHGVDGRIVWVVADLFPAVHRHFFSMILSNPPYVSKEDEVEWGVHAYEPHVALYASQGGFSILRRIFARAFAYLEKDGGLLGVECGKARLHQVAHYWKARPTGKIVYTAEDDGVVWVARH